MEIFGAFYLVAVAEGQVNIVFSKELANDNAVTVLGALSKLGELMKTRRHYIGLYGVTAKKG